MNIIENFDKAPALIKTLITYCLAPYSVILYIYNDLSKNINIKIIQILLIILIFTLILYLGNYFNIILLPLQKIFKTF